jgi:uncharacterized protein YkwD
MGRRDKIRSKLRKARLVEPRHRREGWRRSSPSAGLALFLLGALSCAGPPPQRRAAETATEQPASSQAVDPTAFGWQATTESPREPGAEPFDAELAERCGLRDGALDAVADWLARSETPGPPDVAAIAYQLRKQGSPYVWPRAWTLTGAGALEIARERLPAWSAAITEQGERRCGVTKSRSAVVAVVSDVLADLSPLPTVVRSGTWLDVEAKLLVPATDVKVLVLGPTGRPFAVPAARDGERVRARFRVDRSGVWLTQVLANVAGGPRPVAEALVHADVAPSPEYSVTPAPGEGAKDRSASAPEALFSMINAARASEGVRPLRLEPGLARVAEEHARAMRDARRIAHDLDDGNPAERVARAKIQARAAGENVAHAADVSRAHRALWASPSHRENLLLSRFNAVGVGVAEDADGSVWVCEIFAEL